MTRIALLGSTGSIGTQTLKVIRGHSDKLQVVALAAGKNRNKLLEQAADFGVKHLALMEGDDPNIPTGIDAICDLASRDDVDCVVISVAGVIGLKPTLAAINAGKRVALASKEVLVAAGEVVMPLLRDKNQMLPIDSEHSAIFQCLQGYRPSQVDELILTASGGPFRGKTKAEIEAVSPEEALNHPTWRMGGKITIDSATLMNKGLETIEAKWLFGLDIELVRTVIHPQSIIHSMVKFTDGSVLGQMGWPDMQLPISYALMYPERVPNSLRPWNPIDTPSLSFEQVDHEVFPCLNIAKESVRLGGTMPCAMNAANEEAANAFLRGETSFYGISDTVLHVMEHHKVQSVNLPNLLAVDEEARRMARLYMKLPVA